MLLTRRVGAVVGLLAGSAVLLPTLAGCGREDGSPGGALRAVSDNGRGGNDIDEGWVFTLPAHGGARAIVSLCATPRRADCVIGPLGCLGAERRMRLKLRVPCSTCACDS